MGQIRSSTEQGLAPASGSSSEAAGEPPWEDDGRFDRQVRFAGLGPAGQARLSSARVLIVGCGALGGSLAQTLTRAGVGTLVLADRDVVEPSNLPRQVLFDAADARAGRPKVEAAAAALARVGGPTRIETHAMHVDVPRLLELSSGVDLILDGTDNLPTRYRINDVAVSRGIPWIYAGVVGGAGLVLPVVPGHGPCLRCVFPDPAPPGSLETCDSAGVILPAVAGVAALESALALRLLGTAPAERAGVPLRLTQLDLWNGEFHALEADRDPDCPACGARQFEFLDTAELDDPLVLCGRNAVQLPPPAARPDLEQLAARLERSGAEAVERTPLMLRFRAEGCALTVFPDGRAIVEGTEDAARAVTLFDRFLGS